MTKKVNGNHYVPLRSAIYVEAQTAALRGHHLAAPVPHRPVEQPSPLEAALPSLPPAPPLNVPAIPESFEPDEVKPAPKPRRTRVKKGPEIIIRRQPLPPRDDTEGDSERED
jgi:hypothetical protein